MESRGEAGPEGVPGVEGCDRGSVEVGERQLQEVVQVVVSVRLPRGVPEEGVAVPVGDLLADVKLEVAEGSRGVELCGFIGEPDWERAMRFSLASC